MKYSLVALMLMSSVALAQEPKTFNLKVTEPELNLISKGLQTQPFGEVVPLINKLQAQIIEQNKPVEKPAEKPEDKKPE